MKIAAITAQELLDSRGNPTIEATVHLEGGPSVPAMVPSGASTGRHEALELRDGDPKRYGGKGVLKAVQNITETIAPALAGSDVTEQAKIDQRMIELDGTENKSKLGANAILAVSIACLRGGAVASGKTFYQYVAELFGRPTDKPYVMPVPLINVLNGGQHALNSSDLQEYMLMPTGAPSFAEASRWAAETFHALKKIVSEHGWSTTVGDEGGYAPPSPSNEAPLELIMEALDRAGYKPGEHFVIALDAAASEFHQDDGYHLDRDGKVLSTEEMVDLLVEWTAKYPIVSIEDGLNEDDWEGFALLKKKTEGKVQIVGDDLFATNPKLLRKGIEMDAANCVLVKVNQIGTITETFGTINLALENGMTAIISHRSGETEVPFESYFAAGTGVGQAKIGSMSRSDRVTEYNELMRIERQLGDRAVYAKFPYAGRWAGK